VDLQRNKTSLHIVTSVGYSIEYYDARNNKYQKIEHSSGPPTRIYLSIPRFWKTCIHFQLFLITIWRECRNCLDDFQLHVIHVRCDEKPQKANFVRLHFSTSVHSVTIFKIWGAFFSETNILKNPYRNRHRDERWEHCLCAVTSQISPSIKILLTNKPCHFSHWSSLSWRVVKIKWTNAIERTNGSK